MNIFKEIILNQLIRIPAVKERAKLSHQTGISHNPELLEKQYGLLTKNTPVNGKDILELGPGKTIEIVLKAKEDGASSVSIVDIERYLTDQKVEDNGIEYKIYDGQRIPFPDESFDLIWSSDVYEHVRFPKITVEETFRLLRPNGLAVHIIDLKDHFSYGQNNQNIIFNCLRYPEWLWNMMMWNRSNFVNRLRASEWIKIHLSFGFTIINEEREISEHIRDNFKTTKDLSYLTKYSDDDAVTTTVCLVAIKMK